MGDVHLISLLGFGAREFFGSRVCRGASVGELQILIAAAGLGIYWLGVSEVQGFRGFGVYRGLGVRGFGVYRGFRG